MRAYELAGFGRQRLRCVERPDPPCGHREVRVKIRAVSLNYRDLLVAEGVYNPRQLLPLIPCSDAAGEVVEVGLAVRRVHVGDRVCPMFCQGWIAGGPDRERLRGTLGSPADGVLADQIVLPEEGVARFPEHLSDAEAATLPCAGLTAWSALVSLARLAPGDRILTLGTGGVSIFALQFGRVLGAEVAITSSDDDKLERARSLGARFTVNYRQEPQWGKAVREWTGGSGVDLVVEVGGAGTLEQSLRAVRIGGQVCLIGVLTGSRQEIDILPILMGNVCVQGVLVGSRDRFERMCRAIERHGLTPVVHRIFSFEEAPAAFEYLAGGGHFGKVCIEV
ncbi:MAG: NAD(P)-dependent alcohol dehydrogenase [Armatimonadetes bacterium]|nr:NAD(P)-dependent alcohol dehydrogenase [Armatimonadota bacterium]